MACLRSFSRRSLYSKLLSYKTSSPLFHHDTKPDSSLIRRFHNQSFFQERKQVSFRQGLVSCRHMSSYKKIETFVEFPETLVTKVSKIDECTAAFGNFEYPEDFVHYVVNGIHELTGSNWWISIVLTAFLVNGLMSPITMLARRKALEIHSLQMRKQKVKRDIQIGDPKDVAAYKKWEDELMEKEGKKIWSLLNLFGFDLFIYTSFISGISTMAKKIPSFENGGIFWFTDLSTPDSVYILHVLTGYVFWLTSESEKHISQKNLLLGMKRLSWFLIIFITLQATYKLEPAVYFYMIPSRVCISTLALMLKTNQIAKFRSILGWPDVPVTAVFERQRVMARVINLMREFTKVVKKKDNI